MSEQVATALVDAGNDTFSTQSAIALAVDVNAATTGAPPFCPEQAARADSSPRALALAGVALGGVALVALGVCVPLTRMTAPTMSSNRTPITTKPVMNGLFTYGQS